MALAYQAVLCLRTVRVLMSDSLIPVLVAPAGIESLVHQNL